MTDHLTDRERALSAQIDEQGGQLAAWRDRAIAAEARVAALEAAAMMAYGYLWCVNNEPGTPNQYSPERAAHEARKHLRGMLTTEQRGHGINDVLPIVRAAPPAQPAEPVQRLSDERAAFEAWHNEYRTQELVRRDDTYYNTHVRCRWEGWQARAIESALQPGWRGIESAPKDGTDVWLHADGKVLRAFWLVKPYRETRDLDGNYLDHQDYDEFWMSCADGDEVEDPTEWQPLVTPLPPKATK